MKPVNLNFQRNLLSKRTLVIRDTLKGHWTSRRSYHACTRVKSDSPELKITTGTSTMCSHSTIDYYHIWNDHPCYRCFLIRLWYAGSHSPTRTPLERCLNPDQGILICLCMLHLGYLRWTYEIYPYSIPTSIFLPSILSSWRGSTFFSVSVPLVT